MDFSRRDVQAGESSCQVAEQASVSRHHAAHRWRGRRAGDDLPSRRSLGGVPFSLPTG